MVVLTWVQVPDGSTLSSVMVSPERGAVPTVRVPERVKDWLTAGVVLLVVMVIVVGVRVPTLTEQTYVRGAVGGVAREDGVVGVDALGVAVGEGVGAVGGGGGGADLRPGA